MSTQLAEIGGDGCGNTIDVTQFAGPQQCGVMLQLTQDAHFIQMTKPQAISLAHTLKAWGNSERILRE